MCHTTLNLQCHHIFPGKNRKNSEKYGLKVWLCGIHHNQSEAGVHFNKRLDQKLRQMAERKYLEYYNATVDDFIDIFHKNYIDKGENNEEL